MDCLHWEKVESFYETGDLKHIYKNELDKACFAYDDAYANSKFAAKKTISDKILDYRAYEIALNPKDNGFQRTLIKMVHKVFEKKTGSRINVNEVLAQEQDKQWLIYSKKESSVLSLKILFWQQI